MTAELDPAAVAVLGLGAMGLPMAIHLAGDFSVRGFDLDPARRAAADRAGVQAAAGADEAAASASVVLVAVRTLAQAQACLFDARGAAPQLAAGTVVILTSTVGAEGARELGRRLDERGVELVDAPVSGGSRRAGEGDLLVLASGSESALAHARPVLDALASKLVVVGSHPGDGQSMKIVNQLLCGVHIAAAAEALVLARSFGIEPASALEALGGGAAASFMLADRGPRIVQQLSGVEPEVRSRLDIFIKDMGLVEQAADERGLELPVASAAASLFALGETRGLAAGDDSGVSRLLEDDTR